VRTGTENGRFDGALSAYSDVVAMPAEPSYVPSMTTPLLTAEELLHANIPGKRTELVRGRLIVREPAGYRHGAVTINLTGRLWQHIQGTGAGELLAAETGFTLTRNPDTVRAPDVAFVRRERIPSDKRFPGIGARSCGRSAVAR
jgi:Uma2 family endonuclease